MEACVVALENIFKFQNVLWLTVVGCILNETQCMYYIITGTSFKKKIPKIIKENFYFFITLFSHLAYYLFSKFTLKITQSDSVIAGVVYHLIFAQ